MAGSFSADISKFIRRTGANLDQAVRQTVVMASQGVIQRSPVDTGRLRANWQFGQVVPQGTLELEDKSGAAALTRIAGQVMSLRAGGECWIVNNLPYAGKCEYGHSQQAPTGMVRVTLAGLPAAIEQYVRGLR